MKNIQEPTQTISKKAVSLWRLNSALWLLFFLFFYGGLIFTAFYFNWHNWITIILYVLTGFSIIYSFVKITVYPVYMQRTWRYEIDENFIQLKHGLLNKHHTIVPMSRVEYVRTEQGPLLRKFELSVLEIGTLASSHEIPALTVKEAAEIRNKIAFLAQIENSEANEEGKDADTEVHINDASEVGNQDE